MSSNRYVTCIELFKVFKVYSKIIDKDAVTQLENKLRENRKHSTETVED